MFYETASFFVDNSLTEKRQHKGFNGRKQQHVKLKATQSVNYQTVQIFKNILKHSFFRNVYHNLS